jgi:hypothetical protein
MFWILSLFNLKPGTSPEDFANHLAAGLERYEVFLQTRRQQFVGLYQLEIECKPGTTPPGASLSGSYAEIYLAEERMVSVAALREVQSSQPEPIRKWLDERRGFVAPQCQQRLWLQPFGLSPLAGVPRPLKNHLVHMTLRHLPAGKTIQELEDFDQRIIAAYAKYMVQARWYHIGSYHIFGLPEYMYVDTLDIIEAGDRAEALANDAAVPVTPEMQAIYDECDLFLDKSRERYQFWLAPVVLGLSETFSFA